MLSPDADFIDNLADRPPAWLKWVLAGGGAAAGFNYARLQDSTVPASCIVAGAVFGLSLLLLIFSGMKLVKHLLLFAALLGAFNYVVLIPFGYGNHMPQWLGWLQDASAFLLRALLQLADTWCRGVQ